MTRDSPRRPRQIPDNTYHDKIWQHILANPHVQQPKHNKTTARDYGNVHHTTDKVSSWGHCWRTTFENVIASKEKPGLIHFGIFALFEQTHCNAIHLSNDTCEHIVHHQGHANPPLCCFHCVMHGWTIMAKNHNHDYFNWYWNTDY